MRTSDLIAALAADLPATRPIPIARRIAAAGLFGAAVALAVLLVWLGLRPLDQAAHTGAFWMKASYTLALSLAGWIAVRRLARPGGDFGRAPPIAATAVIALAILAALQLARTSLGDSRAQWLGHTWQSCSLHILVLAAPVWLALVLTLGRLAPTRLSAAGAAAGLLAGGVGATVYGLYCDETAAAFVLVWYTLGIAACAAAGAVLSPRLLRW